MTYQEFFTTSLHRDFIDKQDAVIREAITSAGFDPYDMEFIRANFQRVSMPEDSFEHFWYHFGQPDAKRIISIGQPVFDDGYQNGELQTEIIKHTISALYY